MKHGIYIGATAAFSGKSMLSVGIGQRLIQEGLQIAYMKPLSIPSAHSDGNKIDEDDFFIQKTLGLSQNEHITSPIHIDQDFRMRIFSGDTTNYLKIIHDAYEKLVCGKDLTLVAGTGSMLSNTYCKLDGFSIARELGIKTIIIDRLHHEPHYDTLISYKERLGDSLLGVVFNGVSNSFMSETHSLVKSFLESRGIRILGIIPHDPLMASIGANAIVKQLHGRLITAQEKANHMVEDFLIGTMQVENFASYFRRQPNSAVIVGGDRADIQLVAIEGACPCLILTGNLYPNDIILSRAETLHVPIIITREDTYTVARKMEKIMQQHKFHDVIKVHQGTQLVSANIDFIALRKELAI